MVALLRKNLLRSLVTLLFVLKNNGNHMKPLKLPARSVGRFTDSLNGLVGRVYVILIIAEMTLADVSIM